MMLDRTKDIETIMLAMGWQKRDPILFWDSHSQCAVECTWRSDSGVHFAETDPHEPVDSEFDPFAHSDHDLMVVQWVRSQPSPYAHDVYRELFAIWQERIGRCPQLPGIGPVAYKTGDYALALLAMLHYDKGGE